MLAEPHVCHEGRRIARIGADLELCAERSVHRQPDLQALGLGGRLLPHSHGRQARLLWARGHRSEPTSTASTWFSTAEATRLATTTETAPVTSVAAEGARNRSAWRASTWR